MCIRDRCSNDNVSFLTFFYQILAAAVANSYSGITRISFLHHQTCHRLTYNVTAAQYHTFFSLGFNVVTLQQFKNTVRSSRYISNPLSWYFS